jgi:hypothetical protein
MDDYTKIEKEFGIYKNGKNNLKDKIKDLSQFRKAFDGVLFVKDTDFLFYCVNSLQSKLDQSIALNEELVDEFRIEMIENKGISSNSLVKIKQYKDRITKLKGNNQ